MRERSPNVGVGAFPSVSRGAFPGSDGAPRTPHRTPDAPLETEKALTSAEFDKIASNLTPLNR